MCQWFLLTKQYCPNWKSKSSIAYIMFNRSILSCRLLLHQWILCSKCSNINFW
uniref:Uncharacterized protein n=1 Tax=Loa loa TaxID=7209 RepID=A0A1I7W4B4_LOALO